MHGYMPPNGSTVLPNDLFETDRLLLRPFIMGDVDDAYRLNLDPEVSRYTGDGGPKTREEMEAILRDDVLGDYQKHGFGRSAVIYKETGEFIGFSGLKYLSETDEVDIGYRFARKFWGKGIATESCRPFLDFGFNTLGLTKICAMLLPENTGSRRVLEKLGFIFLENFMEDGGEVAKYILHKEPP